MAEHGRLSEARLRRVIEVTAGLHQARSLDGLLRGAVEGAVELTGARYGALGVIDASGERLEQFITVGVDDDTRRRIGDLPRGRGILGVLISDARSLRLDDMADDPRSVGFPPGHPSMRSFLGVPIMLRGRAFGNLYLTEKKDGFAESDEEVVALLASQAAVAIENARLYDSARRWSGHVTSLNEVAAALTSELDLARLLELIVQHMRRLLDARVVLIELVMPDGTLEVQAADGEGTDQLIGMISPPGSKSNHVLKRRRSERVDSTLEDPEIDPEGEALRLEVRAGLWVPLMVRDAPIGVMAVADKEGRDPRFSADDLRLAEAFAVHAASAVQNARRVSREAVRSMLQAQEAERTRLSRDLHDETGQALAALLMGLSQARRAETLDDAVASLEVLDGLVHNVLADVRTVAIELRPSALDDLGLAAALQRLCRHVAGSHDVEIGMITTLSDERRLPPDIETAIYRIVQESLSNAVKHSGATRVEVTTVERPGAVVVTIEDDGRGFDPDEVDPTRWGLSGMRERASLFGGDVRIQSAIGMGTSVTLVIPRQAV
jgi:signal transduction histidine kinase